MKTMNTTKTILNYDKDAHELYTKSITVFVDTLKGAKDELKKQGVNIPNLESLKGCNFIEAFDNYHKAQKQKSTITKNMLYDKYLDLYGYNKTKLEQLESKCTGFLKRDYQFYEKNHSFYYHCELASSRNPILKKIHDCAPKKKSFVISDFVKINGNKITINVPKELFTLFTTNKKQEVVIEEVNQFLDLAEKLKLNYKDIASSLNSYLVDERNNWGLPIQKGLSEDFKIINFDYNKILQIQ